MDVNEVRIPLKHLLSLKVLISVISDVYLALLHSISNGIQPLSLVMPENVGGLVLQRSCH